MLPLAALHTSYSFPIGLLGLRLPPAWGNFFFQRKPVIILVTVRDCFPCPQHFLPESSLRVIKWLPGNRCATMRNIWFLVLSWCYLTIKHTSSPVHKSYSPPRDILSPSTHCFFCIFCYIPNQLCWPLPSWSPFLWDVSSHVLSHGYIFKRSCQDQHKQMLL